MEGGRCVCRKKVYMHGLNQSDFVASGYYYPKIGNYLKLLHDRIGTYHLSLYSHRSRSVPFWYCICYLHLATGIHEWL